MAEFMTVTCEGNHYEEALGRCFVQMMNLCGQANAQIVRRQDKQDEAMPMIDWVLEHTKTKVLLGGSTVRVEAEFFLVGSDGGDE